jgi:hypothetical protein
VTETFLRVAQCLHYDTTCPRVALVGDNLSCLFLQVIHFSVKDLLATRLQYSDVKRMDFTFHRHIMWREINCKVIGRNKRVDI